MAGTQMNILYTAYVESYSAARNTQVGLFFPVYNIHQHWRVCVMRRLNQSYVPRTCFVPIQSCLLLISFSAERRLLTDFFPLFPFRSL